MDFTLELGRLTRVAIATILLGTLGTPALASDPLADLGPKHLIPLGGSSDPPASITRSLVGRFNGGVDLDLVFLRDGIPEMCVDPETLSAVLDYPEDAETPDIARLPAMGTGVDELLTIGANGLLAWSRDSGEFSDRALGSSTEWTGVTVLRTAALGGDPRHDVIGYRASDQRLVVLIDPDLPSEDEWNFPIGRPALDVVPFVSESGGTVSLAVRCTLGVLVYGLSGGFQVGFSGPAAGALVAVPKSGVSYQDLAWFHPQSGSHVLEMLRNGGGSLARESTSVSFGSNAVVAAVATDFDDKSGHDLIVSHRGAFKLVVLLEQNGSYSLAAGCTRDLVVGPFSLDASTNASWPSVGDLDGDGDADVLFPNHASRELYVVLNDAFDEESLKPLVSSVTYCWDAVGLQPAFLRIQFDAEAAEPVGNRIEIVLWKKPDGDATSASGTRHLVALEPTEGPWDYDVPLDVANVHNGLLSGVYFWTVRYVAVDSGTGSPNVAAFPSTVHGFTSDDVEDGGSHLDYLLDLPGASVRALISTASFTVLSDHTLSFMPRDTNSTDIDVVPVPDYDEGQEPVPVPLGP